jgi:hypothetical protein
MLRTEAVRRLRLVSAAFVVAGTVPGLILVPILPFTFFLAIPGLVAYVNILRKSLGHDGYLESTLGWSLAIVVNACWLFAFVGFSSSDDPPRGGLEVFGLTMAVTCLLVALLGLKFQRDYDASSAA